MARSGWFGRMVDKGVDNLREGGRDFGANLFDGIGSAISDVRGKLVEEAWFGKAEREDSIAERLGWGKATTDKDREQGREHQQTQADRTITHDYDIDR